MTGHTASPTPESSDGGTPRRPPSGHNPDFKRILEWIALLLTLATVAGAAAWLFEWGDVTQYGLVTAAVLMLALSLSQERKHLSRRGKALTFACAYAAMIVLGLVVAPAVWLTSVLTVLFWAFVGIEYRCEIDERPASGTLGDRVLTRLGKLKVGLGYRHQKPSIPIRLAALAAVFGSFGTTLAATHHHHASKKAPPPKEAKRHEDHHKSTIGNGEGHPSNGESQNPKEEKPHRSNCSQPAVYSEAPWATAGIDKMLDGGTILGPSEVGCLEHLHTEYEGIYGMVWGVGVQPETGVSLSLVFDTPRIGTPGVVIAPAVENIEELIKKYKGLAPDGTSFPRYRAGQGDYYLLDTFESGTCVVIRRRSGEADEDPTYTTLVPPVATAWLAIIRALKKWQWPIELQPMKSGTKVFRLTAAGETSPDARITYDPKSGIAYWQADGELFEYPPDKQNDIAPAEVERYVKAYLHH
jgi:hypothetical protein